MKVRRHAGSAGEEGVERPQHHTQWASTRAIKIAILMCWDWYRQIENVICNLGNQVADKLNASFNCE